MILTSGSYNETVNDVSGTDSSKSPFVLNLIQILERNNKSEISLLDIITQLRSYYYDNELSKEKPDNGIFDPHQGGDFYFHLKNDEEHSWQALQSAPSLQAVKKYIRTFPDGLHKNEADQIHEKLVEAQKKWLLCCNEIEGKIQDFERDYLLFSEDNIRSAVNELKDQLNVMISNLLKEERAESKWNEIYPKQDIGLFKEFTQDFSDTPLKALASENIQIIETRMADEKYWEPCNNTRVKAENRLKSLALYLQKFNSNGIHFSDAVNMFRDIEFWVKIENASSSTSKKKLVEEYRKQFSRGEYYSKTEKILKSLDYELWLSELKKNFLQAEQERNFKKIDDILSTLNDSDFESNEEITSFYTEVNSSKKEFEDELQQQASNARNNITQLIKLHNDYEQRISTLNRFAKDILDEITKVIDEKDDEYFNYAEDTRSTEDYESYLEYFSDYPAIYKEDAKKRIIELKEYKACIKSKSIEQLSSYQAKYPHGLMAKEVEQQIDELQHIQEKQLRYQQVITERTKELCSDYLDDYEDEDNDRSNVAGILAELREQEEEEMLFNEIQNSRAEKQLSFCERYLSEYPTGRFINEVNMYKNKAQSEVEDIADFMRAKDKGDINDLEEYCKQRPDGRYLNDAKDSIAFKLAQQANTIAAFEEYIGLFPLSENVSKAKEIIDTLKTAEEKDLVEFNIAKEQNTIEAFRKYIEGARHLSSDHAHIIYAKNQLKELKRIRDDNKSFDEAVREDTEESYLRYLSEYSRNGLNYHEVTKRLRRKQGGAIEGEVNQPLIDISKTLVYLRRTSNMHVVLLCVLIFLAFVGLVIIGISVSIICHQK